MTTFSESGIIFKFSDRWNVLKYDEHRFYRYLSGSGFKGVDFIGILDENQLALIEVKNYKDRYDLDKSDPTEGLITDPISYAEMYAQKFKDTIQLIGIIKKYYQRRWWFKQPRNMLLRIIPKRILLRFDWGFWNFVIQLIDENKEKVINVLWLELNDEIDASTLKKSTEQIQKHLQQQLKTSNVEVVITNSKSTILGFEGAPK